MYALKQSSRLLADPGYASLPERSAVRRQSMELTRALVKVRKPRYGKFGPAWVGALWAKRKEPRDPWAK